MVDHQVKEYGKVLSDATNIFPRSESRLDLEIIGWSKAAIC